MEIVKQCNVESYGSFSEENWEEVVKRISGLYNLTGRQKDKIMNSTTLKLIAAIPFLAGCNEALRTSLSHVAITYMAADKSAKDVFSHNFHDNGSLLSRLERISHFSGGNKDIIDRGMNLLAIIMIADHINDAEEDKVIKKFNPVTSMVWNPELEIIKLEEKIQAIDCKEMDSIISVYEAKASYWEYGYR